jgi:hypothetical protein
VRQRVFFQHIPKTAGSSLIRLLTCRFGAADCETFINGHPRSVQEQLGSKHFLSGHLTYDEVFSLPYIADFSVVTLFRHPLLLVVSALQWMDHYTDPEGHPPAVQDAMRRLWEIDFDEPDDVRGYLAGCMDNGQVRYVTGFDAPLTDLEEFKRRLSSYAFVGVADRFQDEMHRMDCALGLGLRQFHAMENLTPSRRRINLAIPGMVEALTARLQLDMDAYVYVNALSRAAEAPGPDASSHEPRRGRQVQRAVA